MDREAFGQAIIAMLPMLHRIAFSQLPQAADREDAVQETIRRAWEKCGNLRQERYLKTWVVRILLNVCSTIRRRGQRALPAEWMPEQQQRRETPLLDALMSLPEKHRLPLQLHYIEGCSVDETARILGIPAGTVKSRLSRGREKLRELLDEEVFG